MGRDLVCVPLKFNLLPNNLRKEEKLDVYAR